VSKAALYLVIIVFAGAFHSVARAGEQAGTSDSVPAQPVRTLTLDQARELAVAANPELAALAVGVAAAAGASRQAGAFSNPELTFEAEDFGSDRPAEVRAQHTLSISQDLEWPGKRASRRRAARLAGDVASLDLERGRRDLLAEVDRAFAILLGAQERHSIAAENARTARDVTVAVAALVEAGEVSPIEEARARGDEALAAIDLANAERDVDLARRALAALWAEEQPEPFAAEGDLRAEVRLPDRETTLGALAALPDVARWDVETSRAATLLELTRRQSLPDLTASVGARTYSGLDGSGLVAGLAFSLPLATQYAGARAEASARLEQTRHERRAAEARVATAFLAAHEALSRAVFEVDSLKREVLPRAEQVYEALGEGYRRGKFGLVDLLEARRTLAQARLRLVDALTRLEVAAAELHRLVPEGGMDNHGAQR
jgi:cobalt-zinc-cadmium efflux system outer membrane protein